MSLGVSRGGFITNFPFPSRRFIVFFLKMRLMLDGFVPIPSVWYLAPAICSRTVVVIIEAGENQPCRFWTCIDCACLIVIA